jgi:hypothetical protein
MVSLGQEVLSPYSKPDADGEPLYCLPGRAGSRCLTWAMRPGAYLGRVTELILKESPRPSTWSGCTKPTWPKASRPWRWKGTAWPFCLTVR